MDNSDYYYKQIGHALRELMEWAERKKEAEQRMAKLRQLIVANANMLPDDQRRAFIRQADDAVATGFTDKIRRLFRTAHPRALTPLKIRDELADAGVDLTSQSNAMASIHSVVRRLFENGEIERYGAADIGAYRWKQSDEIEDAVSQMTKKK